MRAVGERAQAYLVYKRDQLLIHGEAILDEFSGTVYGSCDVVCGIVENEGEYGAIMTVWKVQGRPRSELE